MWIKYLSASAIPSKLNGSASGVPAPGAVPVNAFLSMTFLSVHGPGRLPPSRGRSYAAGLPVSRASTSARLYRRCPPGVRSGVILPAPSARRRVDFEMCATAMACAGVRSSSPRYVSISAMCIQWHTYPYRVNQIAVRIRIWHGLTWFERFYTLRA